MIDMWIPYLHIFIHTNFVSSCKNDEFRTINKENPGLLCTHDIIKLATCLKIFTDLLIFFQLFKNPLGLLLNYLFDFLQTFFCSACQFFLLLLKNYYFLVDSSFKSSKLHHPQAYYIWVEKQTKKWSSEITSLKL